MDKGKYYTPETEEFHPGFEYEFKSYGQGFVETEVCETGEFFQGEKRVKYLDQEDIESLGFEFCSDKDGFLVLGKKTDKIAIMAKSPNFLIQLHIESKVCRIMDLNSSIGTLFQGTIKNKSELKRLLKQIGYGE